VTRSSENEIASRSSGPSGTVAKIDFLKVLVIGKSQITRVVVSKIVEKCGLRPISEDPSGAVRSFRTIIPGALVLDGGADNSDCDGILAEVATVRSAVKSGAPFVILLSNRQGTRQSLGLSDLVDVVVAKPITPERLQPVINQLVAPHRH
jgi:CheY-like chemotaxis protein